MTIRRGVLLLAVAVALGIPGLGPLGQSGMGDARQVKSRLGAKAMGRVGDGPVTVYTVETYPRDEVDGDGDDDPGERHLAPPAGPVHHRLAAGSLSVGPDGPRHSSPGGSLKSRGPPAPAPGLTRTPPRAASSCFAVLPFLISARRRKALAGLLIAATALPLAGCAKTTPVAAARQEPFKLEKIEGTERKRIRLEPKAAERLHIETAAVTADSRVPYGAVLYDTRGVTAVYTVSEGHVYVRRSVTVASFAGDVAVLSDGPPPGTVVVTAGGSELTGIEFGVGK